MRKVITAAFISMDGVLQAPGGPAEDPVGGFDKGGWVVPYIDEGFGVEVDNLFTRPFDLLLGRKTYEIFAAHWPFAEGGEDDSLAKSFKVATKYVASRQGVDLTWDGSVLLRDGAADVAKLKKQDGPPLITQGSGDLIQTLLAHDLIDEIRTLIFPIVLGKGKRLFEAGLPPLAFKLTHSTTTSAGVTIARYARAGAVQVGDYAVEPPNELERKRRERVQREG
ncbi:dihydrofolate reductase family protein [Terricaulis sp.]|uniref:dihydrofolate reductase family protein n=1 Tax=Terricaulis sp. TaxID=2768686 RepID=UPI002AC6A128|nr:dihydrofolate reductase family protein [Terricaulis sp.]MDZ4689767.1 dihydrofolate reductase family protein [Terricaulis sp.]